MQWQRAKNEYTNNNLVKNKKNGQSLPLVNKKNSNKIKLNILGFSTCRNKQHQIFQGLPLGQEQGVLFTNYSLVLQKIGQVRHDAGEWL